MYMAHVVTLAMTAMSLVTLGAVSALGDEVSEKDAIRTSEGDLEITFIGHASLMMRFGGKIIHVDPCGQEGDYLKLPKADLILVTHDHADHFDPVALQNIRNKETLLVLTQRCGEEFAGGIVMKNGDVRTVTGIRIEAVPAYNIVNKRPDGEFFHPKGHGNGYVLTMGGKRVYVAGDTENMPEMKALKEIDIAFLPMNLPYTMTPGMVADAAKAFKPKVLYPYHFGETDTARLLTLLSEDPEIEVRIRKMQ